MAVVTFSGYGSGYDCNHPFIALGRRLAQVTEKLEQHSLPTPDSPRLNECINLFKARLLDGDISEMYLHSLAVNILKIAVHELSEEGKLEKLKSTINCIFFITPGIGNTVDKKFYPCLKEFYISDRAIRASWQALLTLSSEKPVVFLSAEDKFLLPVEVFKFKNRNTDMDNESCFHWANLPDGYRHFNHGTNPHLVGRAIDAILNIRALLLKDPSKKSDIQPMKCDS